MKKLTFTKSFKFNYAQYDLADNHGYRALLKINYKDNDYELVLKDLAAVPQEFAAELHDIAKDLLQRKHDVNFADTGQL